MPKPQWLEQLHPVYKYNRVTWKKNERRLEGGDEVIMELKRFDWELEPSWNQFGLAIDTSPVRDLSRDSVDIATAKFNHFEHRLNEATYINFPDIFATLMVGHLMKQAPAPEAGLSFGTMGEVPRERSASNPTHAELVYYNVDGIGNDGSQWDNFWAGAMKRAMATGFRWIFVDHSDMQATNEMAVLEGARPFLTEYSPLQVTNWDYQRNRLAFAIVRLDRRIIEVDDQGSMSGNEGEEGFLVLVRQGFEGLGGAYSGGGWWLLDKDGEEEDSAPWATTDGEIPLFPLFYERLKGNKRRFARPAVSELGNVAVSYMNLSSAADYDAWDSGQSIQALLDVDAEGYDLFISKLQDGSKFAPLSRAKDSERPPSIYDASSGAVAAQVFDLRLRAKREEARELAAIESTSVPESSGTSKRAGFSEAKAPRLALMASELEQAQNTAIHFLELRFGGGQPSGAVKWQKKFNLLDLVEDVQTYFTMERLSGARSPTLAVKAMLQVAEDKGLISSDDDRSAAEREFTESVNRLNEMIMEGVIPSPDVGEGGTASLLPRRTSTGANSRLGSTNGSESREDLNRSTPRGS